MLKKFFQKEKKKVKVADLSDKIELSNLRLISIHIPKTAGTSFYEILLDQYGFEKMKRIDITVYHGVRVDKSVEFDPEKLVNAEVIHGHFSLTDLKKYFVIPQNIPVIIWMRNPSERVLSNYYYLRSMLEKQVDKKAFPGLLPRLTRSLLEFASLPGSRNKQSRFFSGMKPEEFSFIGRVENFSENLQRLAKILNWDYEKITAYHHNPTQKKRPEISQSDLDKIKELNSLDLEIYHKYAGL